MRSGSSLTLGGPVLIQSLCDAEIEQGRSRPPNRRRPGLLTAHSCFVITVAMYVSAILMSSLVTVCVAGQTRTEWVDPSPHKLRFVRVDPDVSIEVLDWGGTGPAIVLLAQLGQTAHIYDDWAPRL